MDNQATKYIKKILNKNECKLQLIEPHNHRVNAAECAIQTFKDAFIVALVTTDRDFPLQFWDWLMPQVQDMLNMMHTLRINPAIFGIWSPKRAIRLEQIPPGSTKTQGCCLWGWRYTRIVVIKGGGCMVPRAVTRPLQVWFILRTWNEGLPDIRISRIVPPTLPTTRYDAKPTPAGTHKWVKWDGHRRTNNTKTTMIAPATWTGNQEAFCPTPYRGRTKGARGTHTGHMQGRTKGDQQYTHSNNPTNHRCAKHHAITKPNRNKIIKIDSKTPQASHKK